VDIACLHRGNFRVTLALPSICIEGIARRRHRLRGVDRPTTGSIAPGQRCPRTTEVVHEMQYAARSAGRSRSSPAPRHSVSAWPPAPAVAPPPAGRSRSASSPPTVRTPPRKRNDFIAAFEKKYPNIHGQAEPAAGRLRGRQPHQDQAVHRREWRMSSLQTGSLLTGSAAGQDAGRPYRPAVGQPGD